MNKLFTYLRYLFEYLKYGDFVSVIASIRYVRRRKSHSKDRIIRTSLGHFYCRANTNDFQFANYAYEWDVKRFILKRKDSFNVFIDSGACVGEYCLLLGREPIRCFGFEPIPGNYAILRKNLEMNNMQDKIITFPFGLADRNYTEKFVFNKVNTGASHRAADGQQADCESEMRTFDSFYPQMNLSKHDRILFLLDVEGMEPEVIKGASQFIQNQPHITFILEYKHSGNEAIKEALLSIAPFTFGPVDKYNFYATKKHTTS
jgi:FkbM family methyltransferase